MRESIIQTTINKSLYWLAKRCVTALYKRTRFLTCSWGLDENTDLYLISEESYHDRHRFGLREEKRAVASQKDCYDYNKSEMENIKCGNGITTEIPQTQGGDDEC